MLECMATGIVDWVAKEPGATDGGWSSRLFWLAESSSKFLGREAGLQGRPSFSRQYRLDLKHEHGQGV